MAIFEDAREERKTCTVLSTLLPRTEVELGTAPQLPRSHALSDAKSSERSRMPVRSARERRRAVRYELKLTLDYFAFAEGNPVRKGRGLTSEISHRAVRFTCDTLLPVGTSVQLFIEWPSAQDRPLLLRTVGYVLRSHSREVVALISRHALGPATKVGPVEPLSRGTSQADPHS
jgi:hypothetical protein